MFGSDVDATRALLSAPAQALVDALANGRVDRREFLRRGAILGLTTATASAFLQACASDEPAPQESGSFPGSTEVEVPSTDADRGEPESVDDTRRLVVGVRQGEPNSGLDPVNMTDVGTYAVVAQSFEYLVGMGPDGAIRTNALAASWDTNDDGTAWTFRLRSGPRWSDGTPLDAVDVAATIDRLVLAGNAALADLVSEGAVDVVDSATVRVNLNEPNGNFPMLMSPDNPQSLITPADYRQGTTLDSRIEGTGPWTLQSFDQPTFVATFRPNPDWWGGSVGLEEIEFRGFAAPEDAVAALVGGEIDALQRLEPNAASALTSDSDFVIVRAASSAHHQVWFNTREGVFADRRTRQAVAWAIDRDAMLRNPLAGCSVVGNDHPVHPALGSMPFFDPAAVSPRARDVEFGGGLLADAGIETIIATLRINELPAAQALAELVRVGAGDVGIELEIVSESNDTFYRDTWCPTSEDGDPCEGGADFGIIEYEHRALPDVTLSRAFSSSGIWNSSRYANPEFDRQLADYRRSVDVEAQRAAMGAIQRSLWIDVPAVIPCFSDLTAGHANDVQDIGFLASGQIDLVRTRRP